MGSLLANRVNVSRLFPCCSVDYAAGPLLLREGKLKCAESQGVSPFVLRHEGGPSRVNK